MPGNKKIREDGGGGGGLFAPKYTMLGEIISKNKYKIRNLCGSVYQNLTY